MSRGADAAAGIAAFLSRSWDAEVTVESVTPASVGANRQTLLLDLLRDGRPVPAVASIAESSLGGLPLTAEAGCLRVAAAGGVPVAPLLAVCADRSVAGAPFLVTGRIDGDTVPRHVLRRVESKAGLGAALARQCGDALAKLHAVDVNSVPDEVPRLPQGSISEAYVAGLDQQMSETLQPSPALALGLRWLERHTPAAPPRPSLVHGDYRNGNLIVGDDGLRAILDWELAHAGDPMEDLAWLCLRTWRFRNEHLEVGGFGERRDLRAAYEARGGTWRDDAFFWWKVARTVWWGIGLARQAAAHVHGFSSSLILAASGRRVAEMEYDVLALIRRDTIAGGR